MKPNEMRIEWNLQPEWMTGNQDKNKNMNEQTEQANSKNQTGFMNFAFSLRMNNGARWIFTSYNFVFRYLAWFYLVVFYLINQMLELLMISYLLMKNKNE